MAIKIGILSDTHIPEVRHSLPQQVRSAFAGVDLILHAGDIVLPRVLDELEEIAPVLAAEGNHDLVKDRRISPRQLVSVPGFTIGVVHILEPFLEACSWRVREMFTMPRDLAISDLLQAYRFGLCPEIVVFGDTHELMIRRIDGVLLINPGSATYPLGSKMRLGSVVTLDLAQGKAPLVRVVGLSDL